MSTYGELAIRAVQIYRGGRVDIRSAWNQAAKECFPNSENMQKKCCPRGAFLGLCEEGLVVGVPPGNYTRSTLNKQYGIKAVSILREDSTALDSIRGLWLRVLGGREHKAYNQQIDVIVALWRANLIVGGNNTKQAAAGA